MIFVEVHLDEILQWANIVVGPLSSSGDTLFIMMIFNCFNFIFVLLIDSTNIKRL